LHGSPNDVLDERLEAEWFPDESPRSRATVTDEIRREATKALSLQRIQDSARSAARRIVAQLSIRPGTADGYRRSAYVDALTLVYRPPWQLALHRWLDTVTAPHRTYRRGRAAAVTAPTSRCPVAAATHRPSRSCWTPAGR
jgi:hypothetical protein